MELALCPKCKYVIKSNASASDMIKKREYVGCANCLKVTPVKELIILK